MEEKYLRPSDYEYALLSQHAYQGNQLERHDILPEDEDWCVESTHHDLNTGYFGVLYINTVTKQIVLAHRGTNSLGALIEDAKGVYFNRVSPQKENVFTFTEAAIKLVKKKKGFHLSFTGHSLGAFLAELSVYYCHRSFSYPDVSALTFESPGCYDSLLALQPNHPQGEVNLQQLDVISYLSYPNLVNTCNRHIGTLYALKTDLGAGGWISGWYTKQAHSMTAIVALLKTDTEVFPYVLDWPVGTALVPGKWSQRDYFFHYARFENGKYALPQDKIDALNSEMQDSEMQVAQRHQQFDLDYKGHYTLHSDFHHRNLLPIIHFPAEVATWLTTFYQHYALRMRSSDQETTFLKQLESFAKEVSISEEIFTQLAMACLRRHHGNTVIYCPEFVGEIVHFRKVVSTWLVKKPEQARSILDFVMIARKEIESTPDLEAILRKNVTIESGAIVEGKVYGVYSEFPEDPSQATLEGIKQITDNKLAKIKALGIKIKTVRMEGGTIKPNAKVTDIVAPVGVKVTERQFPSPLSSPSFWASPPQPARNFSDSPASNEHSFTPKK